MLLRLLLLLLIRLLPLLACVRRKIPANLQGEQCKRDCTQDNRKYTCIFNFVLEQHFSDTPGRMVDGHNRSVLAYNGQIPGPTITVCEGDDVLVKLTNKLTGNEFLLGAKLNGDIPLNSTTLHFHGIREKQPGWFGRSSRGGSWSDGVPMVTQCPVLSGESFTYRFLGSGGIRSAYNNAPAGTYWYHSHMGQQRINGAEGKLIIMPRKKSENYDVDLPKNSLFLQEWYPFPNPNIDFAHSILVNGKGKLSNLKYTCTGDDCLRKYKEGWLVEFKASTNPYYEEAKSKTNYEVFDIQQSGKHRFRIIGGIGENVPIRVSVENHNFTAIATDSIDIEPVEYIDALWVAAGERYDIVIDLIRTSRPIKIYLFHGHTNHSLQICSLAWLRYRNQAVDQSIEADCEEMRNMKFKNILNPVSIDPSIWGQSEESETRYIYPVNLTAVDKADGIDQKPLNTQYITMHGMKFNNFSMSFPGDYSTVPFLFQSPSSSKNTRQCGVRCNYGQDECQRLQPPDCSEGTELPDSECDCQHLIQQPWFPWVPWGPHLYWFEIILINFVESETRYVAHPIHQHGGWFNIVGMGQFNQPVPREEIIEMDRNCSSGRQCLPRNYDNPVFKDVIQVPLYGYVIFRTPIDNQGMWIVHCHINYHVEHGMAMVFQIGDPDGPFGWAMGPDPSTAKNNKNKACFPWMKNYKN